MSYSEVTEQFEAQDEEGTVFNVLIYTEFITQGRHTIEGMKTYELSDGTKLNYLSTNEFSTVTRPPVILRRVE